MSKRELKFRLSKRDRMDKEIALNLIRSLETPLRLYEDPIYTPEEKKAIKTYEELAFRFFSDLKADGHITFKETFLLSNEARAKRDRNMRFYTIAMDVANKLPNSKELEAREQWLILLPLYCWYSEMIKNLLLEETKKIYKSYKGKDWGKRFMTLGQFLEVIDGYKRGKHKGLFSELNVALRNSIDHANIDLNEEILYQDNQGKEKSIKKGQMLSTFKKIAPLYVTLFSYRSKVFCEEFKSRAQRIGYI